MLVTLTEFVEWIGKAEAGSEEIFGLFAGAGRELMEQSNFRERLSVNLWRSTDISTVHITCPMLP